MVKISVLRGAEEIVVVDSASTNGKAAAVTRIERRFALQEVLAKANGEPVSLPAAEVTAPVIAAPAPVEQPPVEQVNDVVTEAPVEKPKPVQEPKPPRKKPAASAKKTKKKPSATPKQTVAPKQDVPQQDVPPKIEQPEPDETDVENPYFEDDELEDLSGFDEFVASLQEEAKQYVHDSGDDVGIFLKQMGAIDLLEREEEIHLAETADTYRAAWRRTMLESPMIQREIVKMYLRVCNEDMSVYKYSRYARTGKDENEDLKNSGEDIREDMLRQAPYLVGLLRKRDRALRFSSDRVTKTKKQRKNRMSKNDIIVHILEKNGCKDKLLLNMGPDSLRADELLANCLTTIRETTDENERRELLERIGETPAELEKRLREATSMYNEWQIARNDLVAANLRLVISIAKKYRNRGVSFGDLIDEGNLGLIRAADLFEVERGWKFCTYATWWIRQHITRAIADQSRTIRIPAHHIDNISHFRKTRAILAQQLGRSPTRADVAKELDMTEEEVVELERQERTPTSLDRPIKDDGKPTNLGSLLPGQQVNEDIHSQLMERREKIIELLQCLSYREREIVMLRTGLGDGYSYTLEDCGHIFKVTRERIRQIESKAYRKLQLPINAQKLVGFLE